MHPHAGSATGVAIADVKGAIDHARYASQHGFCGQAFSGTRRFVCGPAQKRKALRWWSAIR